MRCFGRVSDDFYVVFTCILIILCYPCLILELNGNSNRLKIPQGQPVMIIARN